MRNVNFEYLAKAVFGIENAGVVDGKLYVNYYDSELEDFRWILVGYNHTNFYNDEPHVSSNNVSIVTQFVNGKPIIETYSHNVDTHKQALIVWTLRMLRKLQHNKDMRRLFVTKVEDNA